MARPSTVRTTIASTPARGRLLTADQVAIRLECSGRRVRMIPAAELPYLTLMDGGPRKYDPADVDAYVRRRTAK